MTDSPSNSPQKAKIYVYYSSSTEEIEVLFNPNEYTVERSNEFSWDDLPGLDLPVAQFVSGDDASLSMQLFFDTYELQQDVRDHTSKIEKLLDIDSDLHVPPLCEFVWGTFCFPGVLTQATQRFTMFLNSGIPVRATIDITIKKTVNVTQQMQGTPRYSADRTKQRVLKQGEQLWLIANEEYEDSGHWRDIAGANNIDNPRMLESGRRLVIPPLE